MVLTGARGRIPTAVSLLRTRGSGLLLVTGAGKGISKRNLLNQQGDAAENLPEVWEKIEVEDQASSTIENAIETAKILSQRGIEKVILVTSDFHLPRSLAIFRRVYPRVKYWPYPVVAEGAPLGFMESSYRPVVEFVKYFAYRHFFQHTL